MRKKSTARVGTTSAGRGVATGKGTGDAKADAQLNIMEKIDTFNRSHFGSSLRRANPLRPRPRPLSEVGGFPAFARGGLAPEGGGLEATYPRPF